LSRRVSVTVIPKGERYGLMLAAVSRDPRKWAEPDRFDIRRDLRGDLGWGFGLRPCVGRTLAPLEADALLGALIKHIERFEPAGEPEPWTQARRCASAARRAMT
jgi:cytochrome P450